MCLNLDSRCIIKDAAIVLLYQLGAFGKYLRHWALVFFIYDPFISIVPLIELVLVQIRRRSVVHALLSEVSLYLFFFFLLIRCHHFIALS